jgi:cell division protein ZapE
VVRRFTWLVDVFYDQRVKLVLSAETPPEDLVVAGGELSAPERLVTREYGRTASRLREMQSKDYFSRKHASASDPGMLSK